MYSERTKYILDRIISLLLGISLIWLVHAMIPKPITAFIDNPYPDRLRKNLNQDFMKGNCWSCNNPILKKKGHN